MVLRALALFLPGARFWDLEQIGRAANARHLLRGAPVHCERGQSRGCAPGCWSAERLVGAVLGANRRILAARFAVPGADRILGRRAFRLVRTGHAGESTARGGGVISGIVMPMRKVPVYLFLVTLVQNSALAVGRAEIPTPLPVEFLENHSGESLPRELASNPSALRLRLLDHERDGVRLESTPTERRSRHLG